MLFVAAPAFTSAFSSFSQKPRREAVSGPSRDVLGSRPRPNVRSWGRPTAKDRPLVIFQAVRCQTCLMANDQHSPAGFIDLSRLMERMEEEDRAYIVDQRERSLALGAVLHLLKEADAALETFDQFDYIVVPDEHPVPATEVRRLLMREALVFKASHLYLQAVDRLAASGFGFRYDATMKRLIRDCDSKLREIAYADRLSAGTNAAFSVEASAGHVHFFKSEERTWIYARPHLGPSWESVERLVAILIPPAMAWVREELKQSKANINGQLGRAVANGLEIAEDDYLPATKANGQSKAADKLEREYLNYQPCGSEREQQVALHLRQSEEKRKRRERGEARAAKRTEKTA